MNNREKLEVLKKFLTENKIKFKENVNRRGQNIHLYIPKHQICVRLSDENDQEFYLKVHHGMHPLFIRSNETAEFVVEKMQNLIIDLMQRKQRLFEKQKKYDNK